MKKFSADTFQSSPGPKAGRCADDPALHIHNVVLFQSSPGPKAGRCYARIR